VGTLSGERLGERSGEDRIGVLVVEDEQPLREALVALLSGEPDLVLVGTAADADAALALAEANQPDVILQDVRIPGGGGARVAREAATRAPGASMLALSAYEDRASVLAMLRSGAVGYLVKGTPPAEILEAIRRAARGQASLSADLAANIVGDLLREADERRAAEETARRDEEQVRALLDSAPDAAVVIDARGMIALVNKQTEALFGYERGELVGHPVEMLIPARFHARHHEHRGGYFRDPRTRPMGAGLELAGQRKNGTDFPVDISLSAIETDEGRLATAFIRDATDRVEAEEIRRRNEERLAQLIESAPDAVVIIDEAGKVILVNEQTEELFGYHREQLIGERVEVLLPERFRHQHVGHRAGYFASPRTRPMGAGLELAGLRRDGSEFPIDISLSATDTPDGRVATARIRDITERKAQAELEQTLAERRALLRHLVSTAEEERQRIAADIHDDSIQVMAAAGMRLQILRRTLDDPEQLQLLSALEQTIELSIGRLRHLLFELHPPVLDQEGLTAALRMYLDEAEHQSPIRYSLDDRLRAQPPEDVRLIIYRIAQESLTNVRKHSQARTGRVMVEERGGGFLVRITDDGIGFDADSVAPTPGHLGLTAIRERAELAGGWLKITSAKGSGTTVEFWIPALARWIPADHKTEPDPIRDPATK
jgi:PAS domain S-box-containing protein